MRTLNIVSGLVATLALTACATQGQGGNQATFGSDNDCFFARAVSDWRALDNRNLLVFTGRRSPYHVELSSPSMRLRSQETIAFSDRSGRICPFGGDAVIVGGPFPERLTISSIRRLSEGELEEVYLQFGVRRPEIIETSEDPIE